MTLYDLLAKSKPMQKNKADMINVCAKQLKRPTHEIKEELDNLMQQGKIKCAQGQYYTCEVVKHKETKEEKKQPIPATKIAVKIDKHFIESPYPQNMADIATWYGVTERKLRDVIHRINFRGYTLPNGEVFTRKIYGDNKGYRSVRTQEDKRQMLNKRYRMMLDKIDEVQILIEDFAMDNQLQFDFDTLKTKIQKSISDDI